MHVPSISHYTTQEFTLNLPAVNKQAKPEGTMKACSLHKHCKALNCNLMSMEITQTSQHSANTTQYLYGVNLHHDKGYLFKTGFLAAEEFHSCSVSKQWTPKCRYSDPDPNTIG